MDDRQMIWSLLFWPLMAYLLVGMWSAFDQDTLSWLKNKCQNLIQKFKHK